MFCGSMARMTEALAALQRSGMDNRITVLRTEYPERDLSMIDVLNTRAVPRDMLSNAGPRIAATGAKRSWPSVTTTMMWKCLSLPGIRLSWGMPAKSCAAAAGM